MDPKAQMPDIKTEVNKVDNGDKKKSSGLLGSLFGGGGSGAGGLGGLSASGAAASGGLLATKAGLIALIVMGSAVAGGLGLAGYKMFGPGDADHVGGNVQVFQTKPKEADGAGGVAPVAADGSSASLNYLAAAAQKDKQADASAPTDQTAGDAAKAAADEAAKKAADEEAAKKAAADAAAAKGNTPINSGSGGGAIGSMSHLNGVKKLGALSGVSGGGSSSASAGSKSGGAVDIAGSKNGSSSSFARGGGAAAKTSSSSGRGIASRKGSSGRNQLASVLRDQRGAGSSSAAGRTYDGAGPGGNNIGGENAIGADGAGAGNGQQPKSLPGNNNALNQNKQEHIPEPPAKDVTPWQGMLNAAVGLMAVAGLLMYAASMLLKDMTPAKSASLTIAKVLLGLAVLAAAAAVALGTRIATADMGQKLQGGLIVGGALFAGGMAAYLLTKIWSEPNVNDEKGVNAIATVAANSSTLVMISGGAAACALAGAMMAPKTTVKEDEAKKAGVPYSYVMPAPVNRYTV